MTIQVVRICPLLSWPTHPFHIRANAAAESLASAQQQTPAGRRQVERAAATAQRLASHALVRCGVRLVRHGMIRWK